MYSHLDGMVPVVDLVKQAHRYGHQALALTDHGVMSGVFQLYTECKKRDMLPFPGVELYVVDNVEDKDSPRYHMTAFAFTTDGYKALVALVTQSHMRDHFHHKPRIDMTDIIGWAEMFPSGVAGIAFTTGCFFGPLIQKCEDVNEGARLVKSLAVHLPNLYIEAQHHNTDHDDGRTDTSIALWLRDVSNISGIPMIVAQDCHYLKLSHADLHSRMKQLAYGATDPGDVGFPGDGYHLSTASWVQSHFENQLSPIWEQSMDSMADLMERHTLSIPQLDKYRYSVPTAAGFTGDPQKKLKVKCLAAMKTLGLDKKVKYRDRLAYELGVIDQLGFADYFWLVAWYCNRARAKGIYIMARGSANGSLVCWLMNITDLDPIYWKLSFDRFLTLDRERPPDIDMDIEDDRRHEVIDDINRNYEMLPLGTYGQLGVQEDGSGGAYVTWMASRRRAMDKDTFNRRYGRIKTLHDLRKLEPEIVDDLMALTDPHDREKGITVLKAPSVHAAGYILSSEDLKIHDWIPQMLVGDKEAKANADSQKWRYVAQMTMDDAENVGLVKIDLLGLRSLRTLRRTVELVAEEGPKIDPYMIPLGESAVYKLLREGREMTGVFQMEGYSAAKGCRQVKVKSIQDLILVNALYRPAAQPLRSVYLQRRRKLEDVTYPHDVFEPYMRETFGVPIYQEQALDVLRGIGFEPVGINQILKAIKRSGSGAAERNAADFAKNRAQFNDLCRDIGMTDRQMDRSWTMIESFAGYGFNRAHSTAYSLLGYRLAWFKVMYPLEFHTALLETTVTSKKHDFYVRETRLSGVPILPPDVNVSGANWTADRQRKAVRRGLVSISGIGVDASDELWGNAPFTDMDDLIERCAARTITGGKSWAKDGVLIGVLEKLRQAGALKSLGVE